MSNVLHRLLSWFRSTSLFNWHNTLIENQQRKIDKLAIQLLDAKQALEQMTKHKEVLQYRIDNWISLSEGSRYRKMYQELSERHTKMTNWLYAANPELVEKAREAFNPTRFATVRKSYVDCFNERFGKPDGMA